MKASSSLCQSGIAFELLRLKYEYSMAFVILVSYPHVAVVLALYHQGINDRNRLLSPREFSDAGKGNIPFLRAIHVPTTLAREMHH